MKLNELGSLVSAVFVICIYVFFFFGWGMNIYKLTKCDFEPSYKAEIIRGIGIIVAPVGSIVGYIDIGE